MAPPVAPEVVIAPPANVPPNHSLLLVGGDLLNFDGDDTELTETRSDRWEAGVTFLAEGCDAGGLFVPCTDDTFFDPAAAPTVTYIPMVAWAAFQCSSFGRGGADYKGRAKRKLDAVASYHLELEFWRGTITTAETLNNPFLADTGTMTVINSTAVPLVQALSILQYELGVCNSGSPGVIHAPRQVVNMWRAAHVINSFIDDEFTIRYFDMFGNQIIAGAGYDGSSPAGVVDATGQTAWVYATGVVGVAEGKTLVTPETEREALDRGSNLLTYYANRSVAATWDTCCHLGINVDICNTCCTGDLYPPA